MTEELKIAGAPADKRAELEAAATADNAAREASAKAEAQAIRVAEEQARQARERAAMDRASAPAPVPSPAPAPVPSPAYAKEALNESRELRIQAEAERDRLRQLGDEYDARLRRERERDRITALRAMGATGSLSDEQLLTLAPDVDPHAPEGKTSLNEWRERNAGLFAAPSAPAIPSPEEMIAKIPAGRRRSASGLYDEKYLAELLHLNLGRK